MEQLDRIGKICISGLITLTVALAGLLAVLSLVSSPIFAQDNIGQQYNAVYSDSAEQATFSHAPNAFLVEFTKTLTPGRALDVGMGQGRNTMYLAQHGWQATGIDLSDVGVNLAREEAAKLGLQLNAIVADAQTYGFGEEQWDLIVFCYVPLDSLVERVAHGLRRGWDSAGRGFSPRYSEGAPAGRRIPR